ncbi:hypothetical protein ABES03_02560 [Neobacillus rhizosphaerae]|uniref:hypothetical protein n=1 Tax=Neobacillus rhizosphaerae TaxID=2880965 RepID=UPI003D266845
MYGRKYETLIKNVFDHYIPYIEMECVEEAKLIDPNDKKVIGFHYGETHFAAAMIIYGYESSDRTLIQKGIAVLSGFMKNINEYNQEPAYHWDFNNFALCVLYEYLKKHNQNLNLQKELKIFVLNQKDSNNPTINWIPMRIFVNSCKYEWTNERKYKDIIDKLKKIIAKAQYQDGYFEDLLPKGTSFNFQYHIFTTAMLAFLNLRGIKIADFDIAVQQVENLIDPLGDANYLGRGINQIFAWGPLIYLLDVTESPAISRALQYLESVAPDAVEKNNLMLNDFLGEQKTWWWDYHYASVYHAHFALWLVLALIEKRKTNWERSSLAISDSGVHILKKGGYFVCTFDGRKHYLAERGKQVANICHKEHGYVFKGAFGPYPGKFGNLYSSPVTILHNYFGPISKKVSKFGSLSIKPIFPENITVGLENGKLLIRFSLKKTYKNLMFNLPLYGLQSEVKIVSDRKSNIDLKRVGAIDGPYGRVNIYQCDCVDAKTIDVLIGGDKNEISLYK